MIIQRSVRLQFMVYNLHEHLIELHKLFIIYLSIPVFSASSERSFSTFQYLKTYIRNTMNQQRLSDLAVLSINSDMLDDLNFDEVIDVFMSQKIENLNSVINFFAIYVPLLIME